jgi:hypothetical protein
MIDGGPDRDGLSVSLGFNKKTRPLNLRLRRRTFEAGSGTAPLPAS